MNKEEFMNWINSLNPVVIDVDEEGNPVDQSQIDGLAERIKSEVNEIQDKQNGHQKSNKTDNSNRN
jgi:hypothetical protein